MRSSRPWSTPVFSVRVATARWSERTHMLAFVYELALLAHPRSYHRRGRRRYRRETKGNPTRRSHALDGSGAPRSPGTPPDLRLPRVSSPFRWLTDSALRHTEARNDR